MSYANIHAVHFADLDGMLVSFECLLPFDRVLTCMILEATEEPSTFGSMQKEPSVHSTIKDLHLLHNLKMAPKSVGGMLGQLQPESVLEGRKFTLQVGSSWHSNPIFRLIMCQTSTATGETTTFGCIPKAPLKYGSTRARLQEVKHLQMWAGGHKA